MKPFHFSLESLRPIREQRERLAQRRYAEALRAGEQATAQWDAAILELAGAWGQLCRQLRDDAAAFQLQQTRAWCDALERRCERLAAAAQSAQRAAREAWRDMMRATRERQTLDRLREKSRRAYDRDAGRAAQKELDEMGINLRTVIDDVRAAAGSFANPLQIGNQQS